MMKVNFIFILQEVKANPEDENNEDESIDSTGINIKLKEFLSTQTVLAIVYYTLRKSENKIELNDNLALNILVLIYRFADDFDSTPFDPSTTIHCNSLIDLISQFKKVLFDFDNDKENGHSTIHNRMNKQNFKTFLNMKISYSKSSEQKSLVDILIDKGEIGKSVLRKVSIEIKIDSDSNEKQMIKEINKKRAKKLKQSIISQYKSAISSYSSINSVTDSTDETNTNEDFCSICSSTIEDQILSYPLYTYRTKIPFIIDKPPLTLIKEGSEMPIDEDKNVESHDFFGLFSRRKEEKPKQVSDKIIEKRVTEGNNFVIQFSICQHTIHQTCVNSRFFKCPIDRSSKNCFLPCIDKIKPDLICNSEKVGSENVSKPIKNSIDGFIQNFTNFFDNKSANFVIELVKSISGLIATFEIRLRNLPDCLDSSKNKILIRNLFLTTWYAYRILEKNEIKEHSLKRLTLFQKFILRLIKSDQLEGVNKKKDEFQSIFSSFFENNKDNFIEKDSQRKDKEIFLFLKRVCLAKHFLLNDEDHNQLKFITNF